MSEKNVFANLEVTPWFSPLDAPPLHAGVYQTCAEPERFAEGGVLFRYYNGQRRWGPSDWTPDRARERATAEACLLVMPRYYRGLARPAQSFDRHAFEVECYRLKLENMDWGFPLPSKLSEVRKSAARIDALVADARRLDPQGVLWNKYAPPQFTFVVETSSAAALEVAQEVVTSPPVTRRVALVEDPVQVELPLASPRVRLIV